MATGLPRVAHPEGLNIASTSQKAAPVAVGALQRVNFYGLSMQEMRPRPKLGLGFREMCLQFAKSRCQISQPWSTALGLW